MGYSPWGRKEASSTEPLTLRLFAGGVLTGRFIFWRLGLGLPAQNCKRETFTTGQIGGDSVITAPRDEDNPSILFRSEKFPPTWCEDRGCCYGHQGGLGAQKESLGKGEQETSRALQTTWDSSPRLSTQGTHPRCEGEMETLRKCGFLAAPVVEDPPDSEGDTGSIPGLGRSHMLSSSAREPQLLRCVP